MAERGMGLRGAMDDALKRDLIAFLPRLRRFALGLTGNRAEGDDLVQATCERALRYSDHWMPGTRLDAWLFRMARNLFLNDRRDRRRRGPHLPIDEHPEGPAFDGERAAVSGIALEAVTAGLQRLPEEQRSALLLIAVEGLGYREAAEVLGVPIGTVTSRLARARGALRAELDEPARPAAAAHRRELSR
ncbi:MAG TPA: RNA polymerase sigma factor [Kiloniellales bacterium]|nr:RNA polymerase sigma factor [Kiloniellales bacterium]